MSWMCSEKPKRGHRERRAACVTYVPSTRDADAVLFGPGEKQRGVQRTRAVSTAVHLTREDYFAHRKVHQDMRDKYIESLRKQWGFA